MAATIEEVASIAPHEYDDPTVVELGEEQAQEMVSNLTHLHNLIALLVAFASDLARPPPREEVESVYESRDLADFDDLQNQEDIVDSAITAQNTSPSPEDDVGSLFERRRLNVEVESVTDYSESDSDDESDDVVAGGVEALSMIDIPSAEVQEEEVEDVDDYEGVDSSDSDTSIESDDDDEDFVDAEEGIDTNTPLDLAAPSGSEDIDEESEDDGTDSDSSDSDNDVFEEVAEFVEDIDGYFEWDEEDLVDGDAASDSKSAGFEDESIPPPGDGLIGGSAEEEEVVAKLVDVEVADEYNCASPHDSLLVGDTTKRVLGYVVLETIITKHPIRYLPAEVETDETYPPMSLHPSITVLGERVRVPPRACVIIPVPRWSLRNIKFEKKQASRAAKEERFANKQTKLEMAELDLIFFTTRMKKNQLMRLPKYGVWLPPATPRVIEEPVVYKPQQTETAEEVTPPSIFRKSWALKLEAHSQRRLVDDCAREAFSPGHKHARKRMKKLSARRAVLCLDSFKSGNPAMRGAMRRVQVADTFHKWHHRTFCIAMRKKGGCRHGLGMKSYLKKTPQIGVGEDDEDTSPPAEGMELDNNATAPPPPDGEMDMDVDDPDAVMGDAPTQAEGEIELSMASLSLGDDAPADRDVDMDAPPARQARDVQMGDAAVDTLVAGRGSLQLPAQRQTVRQPVSFGVSPRPRAAGFSFNKAFGVKIPQMPLPAANSEQARFSAGFGGASGSQPPAPSRLLSCDAVVIETPSPPTNATVNGPVDGRVGGEQASSITPAAAETADDDDISDIEDGDFITATEAEVLAGMPPPPTTTTTTAPNDDSDISDIEDGAFVTVSPEEQVRMAAAMVAASTSAQGPSKKRSLSPSPSPSPSAKRPGRPTTPLGMRKIAPLKFSTAVPKSEIPDGADEPTPPPAPKRKLCYCINCHELWLPDEAHPAGLRCVECTRRWEKRQRQLDGIKNDDDESDSGDDDGDGVVGYGSGDEYDVDGFCHGKGSNSGSEGYASPPPSYKGKGKQKEVIPDDEEKDDKSENAPEDLADYSDDDADEAAENAEDEEHHGHYDDEGGLSGDALSSSAGEESAELEDYEEQDVEGGVGGQPGLIADTDVSGVDSTNATSSAAELPSTLTDAIDNASTPPPASRRGKRRRAEDYFDDDDAENEREPPTRRKFIPLCCSCRRPIKGDIAHGFGEMFHPRCLETYGGSGGMTSRQTEPSSSTSDAGMSCAEPPSTLNNASTPSPGPRGEKRRRAEDTPDEVSEAEETPPTPAPIPRCCNCRRLITREAYEHQGKVYCAVCFAVYVDDEDDDDNGGDGGDGGAGSNDNKKPAQRAPRCLRCFEPTAQPPQYARDGDQVCEDCYVSTSSLVSSYNELKLMIEQEEDRTCSVCERRIDDEDSYLGYDDKPVCAKCWVC